MPNNSTKLALEASLKNLLLKKPVDKITITDLTNDCGITRMAFYYHFKDIYDLVEWSCYEDASRALQGKKTYETWQEGLMQIFEAVMENKPFIMNVYHALSREQIENYLFRLTRDLIMNVIKECSKGMNITVSEQSFIADFYKYSFVGVMLDWIKKGMKENYHEIVNDICITMSGNIKNSLQNFADIIYNLMIIFLHALFNPVKHDTDKAVFIKVCDEALLTGSYVHTLRAFLNNIHN